MLRHYLTTIRKLLPVRDDTRRATLWANRAFDDFVVPGGDRRTLIATIADHALRLTALARNLGAGATSKSELAKALLNVCAWIDTGQVRLEGSRLRAYEDISIQVT